MLLAHEPVHAHRDHGRAVDGALPGETLRGDRPRVEHADRRRDRGGRDGHLVCAALVGVEAEAEGRRQHVDRLVEADAEEIEHRARLRVLGAFPEEHDLLHDELGTVDADVGELLGADVAHVARE